MIGHMVGTGTLNNTDLIIIIVFGILMVIFNLIMIFVILSEESKLKDNLK